MSESKSKSKSKSTGKAALYNNTCSDTADDVETGLGD